MATGELAHSTRTQRSHPHVLIVAYGGPENPSTRLRILQYRPALEAAGYTFSTFFVPQDGGDRTAGVAELLPQADVVLVQRVLTRNLIRQLRSARRPVVFDMDDALHYVRQSQYGAAATPQGPADNVKNAYRTAVRGNRFHSSRKRLLDEMLSLSAITIVGNTWLFEDLGLNGDAAVVIPTSVWVDDLPCKRHAEHRPVTLGWIGVRSNLYHLDLVRDALVSLRDALGDRVELMVVSNGSVRMPVTTRNVPWSLESETASVLGFDIGLMPLQDDPFSRGKCAFKAVFCMALGVPVVVSPVGANTSLVEDGRNGFLASTSAEWVQSLTLLVDDIELRKTCGRRARDTIEAGYAAEQVAPRLGHIFSRVAGVTQPRGLGR